MVNDQDFAKLTGGTKQRGTRQRGGTGQRRIRYLHTQIMKKINNLV